MNIRIILNLLILPMAALAQPADNPKAAPNPATNGYATMQGFFKMPAGRVMGASSAVAGDRKGNIWVVDRCAANTCIGSNLAPVMQFDRRRSDAVSPRPHHRQTGSPLDRGRQADQRPGRWWPCGV